MINHHRPQSETSSISSDADIFDGKTKKLSINGSSVNDNAAYLHNEPDKVANMRSAAATGNSRTSEKSAIPTRKKPQIEREEELTQMKLDAMNQIENTIKITDMLKDASLKLSESQSDNKNLRKELNSCHYQLEEAKSINRELVERLHAASNARTQHKIELENQRTHDLVDVTLSPNISFDRYVKDIINSRDLLSDQNNQLKAELDRSYNQITLLKETVEYLESLSSERKVPSSSINDSNIDSRSKSELLKLVRDKIDDKMIWMEYAIKLTQAAVFSVPELLQIDGNLFSPKESEGFCCKNEEKWATFAITLLQKVNESHPTVIQDLINSQNAIPSAFFSDKLTKRT